MKISIITPNYNYANFIGFTIESILNQNYPDFEHIIVDDGSTDNSVEVIQSYIKKYPDNFLLIQQENKGQSTAINAGLKLANGDIIGWINSDDLYCENVFTKVLSTFRKHPFIDAVFGDILIINKKGKQLNHVKYLPFDYPSGVFNGFGKIIPSNGIFWKSSLSKEIGLFDERFHFAMDSEYWSRLLYNRKVMHIPLPIAKFRYHENAKTVRRRERKSDVFFLAKAEDKIVKQRSFNKLFISHFVSMSFFLPLAYYYKLKRYILKLLLGHYFK